MEKILKKIKNFIAPTKENEYHPHLFRHEISLFIFLFIIVLEFLFILEFFIFIDKNKFSALVLPDTLINLTNEERSKIKLPELKKSSLLEQAAKLKAEDMVNKGYFSHKTPEGRDPWFFLESVGYKYSYAGENLAVNFFDSKAVSEAWMASPSHKSNIIKSKYTEIGIATAEGKYKGRDSVFVVQFFGTPDNTDKSATIENKINKIVVKIDDNIKKTEKEIINKIQPEDNNNLVLSYETEKKEDAKQDTLQLNTPTQKDFLEFSLLEKIFKFSKLSINYFYFSIIVILLISLSLIFFIKSEIKHPLVMIKGSFLIIVITSLLFINQSFFARKIEIPKNQEANSVFIAN